MYTFPAIRPGSCLKFRCSTGWQGRVGFAFFSLPSDTEPSGILMYMFDIRGAIRGAEPLPVADDWTPGGQCRNPRGSAHAARWFRRPALRCRMFKSGSLPNLIFARVQGTPISISIPKSEIRHGTDHSLLRSERSILPRTAAEQIGITELTGEPSNHCGQSYVP